MLRALHCRIVLIRVRFALNFCFLESLWAVVQSQCRPTAPFERTKQHHVVQSAHVTLVYNMKGRSDFVRPGKGGTRSMVKPTHHPQATYGSRVSTGSKL